MSDKYKINAWMVCREMRFNAEIATVVEAEKEPSEQEFRVLLGPAAEEALEKYQAAGYRYELYGLKVIKL